jgi:hypothetical protein
VPETPDTIAAKIIGLRTWFDIRLATLERRFDALERRIEALTAALTPPQSQAPLDGAHQEEIPAVLSD